MAWTTSKDANVYPYGWCAFRFSSSLGTNTEILVAAPAVSGQSLYIEQIILHTDGARTYTIGEDLNVTAVKTPYFSIQAVTTAGNTWMRRFERPVKLAADAELRIDVEAPVVGVTVIVMGYTK